MILSRRASLMLGLAASAATLMPRLAMSQTATPTSFSFPVEGGQVVFHPVDHASMVVETPGGVIYVDPVGGADLYRGMPQPSLARWSRRVARAGPNCRSSAAGGRQNARGTAWRATISPSTAVWCTPRNP